MKALRAYIEYCVIVHSVKHNISLDAVAYDKWSVKLAISLC
jgi:hypothetical protein